MKNTTDSSAFAAADIRVALGESYPDSTYGSVPVLDRNDALEAYRAYADGGLETVPAALAAYVGQQQRQWP